jgi:hypothetical protein
VKVGLLALFIVAGLAIPFLHSALRVPLNFGPTTAKGWFEALRAAGVRLWADSKAL